MYRQFSRLETIKYLGVKTPPAYVVNLTGDAAFKTASAQRGALNGIQLIKGTNEDSGVITLRPSVSYGSGTRNTLSSWSGKLINTYQVSGAFGVTGNSGLGLIYDSVTPTNTEATITSTWKFKANEGFTVRMFPYVNPDKSAAPSLHSAFQVGKWRIIFYGEKVLLTRINSNWNLTKEKTALDSNDGSLLGPKTYNPDTNTDAIYDIYQELETPDQNNSIIGNYYELSVLPEPDAGIHVAIGARGFDDAKGQTFVQLLDGETGDIYTETPLVVYTRSNAMFFQVGTMGFADASLIVGPLSTPYAASDWSDSFLGSNISYNVRKNAPTGTSASVSHEIINTAYFQFNVNLTTTDSSYTPFVYWAQAALQGGAYLGDTQFQIDTNDLLDADNNSPIMDIQFRCDGDMRRRDFSIDLRNAAGIQTKLFEYNGNPQSFMLENQLANLSMGTAHDSLSAIITNGLITECEAHDAKLAEHTSLVNGFHPWTTMSLTLSDAWAILDNDIITQELAGDGLYLGDYVKHLLIDGGYTVDQINISDTAGRVLPQAAYGELPCVMPGEEQSRGDYLRDLFDKYGHEWQLYYDNAGIWQMRTRPTSIAQVGGVDAAFTTHFVSPTDRIVILSELDWVRDARDFYNVFRVEGAEIRGKRICQEYVIWNSIRGIVNTDSSNNYLGYAKPYGTVRDEGIRTEADAQLVLRSLVMRNGVSCRFLSFESQFTLGLYQWDRITCDGKNYAVWRADGGSLKSDRMSLQVIQV